MPVEFLTPPSYFNTSSVQPEREFVIQPSSLETIDQALYNWLYEELRIFSTTNKGRKRIPVIWVSAARAYQIKNDKEVRDSNGNLKLPLITVQRTSITKDSTMHGKLTSHIYPVNAPRGGTVTVARRIQQEKTALFAANEGAKLRGGGGDTNNTDDVSPGCFCQRFCR